MTREHQNLSDNELWQAFLNYGTVAAVAKAHPYTSDSTLRHRIKKLKADKFVPSKIKIAEIPSSSKTIEEILKNKKEQFIRSQNYEEASKLVDITVPTDGPVAVVHIGDPHLDDDGCDIAQLEMDMDTVLSTKAMYAGNVGDLTNNWVGRLAVLYAEQHTTETEAWALVEWFLAKLSPRLLYTVGGNHDLWKSGELLLNWIARQTDNLYRSSEVRINLKGAGGNNLARVNCRHDFSGSSQFSSAHGQTKALMLGVRDHIAISGHRHKSGYNIFKDPTEGITCHAIQVSSYKMYDRYAKDKGFRDQHLGASCTTVINTRLDPTHADYIKPFWSVQEGAEYLKFLRGKK